MKKPKIYHQSEKSSHCGACATASVLDWFGEEPEGIPLLYKHLREESYCYADTGMYAINVQSYFLRKDWVCLQNTSGGPSEADLSDSKYSKHNNNTLPQRIATWRIINQMLKDGYLCILQFKSAAGTEHFAVVYDAFIRRNIYWIRLACSAQGYMEQQVETFLTDTGTTQLFIKPYNNEYR